MTVTVKLITEQTTNQLVDSVNKAQADNWFPVCGVVCFNARYTQLVAQDTERTEPPTCDYFIVDAEDGIGFAKRVNELLAMSPGAVCLSSVQYVQARYIQAYGDDSLHSGGGGGDLLKWYTEDAAKTYPIIDVDPNISKIGLGNEWAGYIQLLFRTGGNDAGHILADDGTLTLCKTDGSELRIMNDDVNLLVKGISVLNSSGDYTNLIAQGSGVTLSPGFAGMSSSAGALELDETRGIKLYGNGGVNSIIDANPTQSTFGDLAAALNINGETITVNGSNRTSLEMDASALRVKRGTNNLFSISDSGGAMTWNSMVRCVWDANGWNVSRDNGVAFSSRATMSAMIGPNGSRVETNNTGLTLTSSDNPSQQSKLAMLNGEIKGYVTSPAEPFLEAGALNTTLRYVGNELKLHDGADASLSSAGADVILNALTGHVTFNALGQSMSIGPAGLRYTVDGHDVIQSGSTTGRSAPDLTIHRPGGGNMMLDMTLDSATLTAGDNGKVELSTAGGTMVSGKDGYAYMDTNGVKIASTSGNRIWCTNGQYIQFDTTYGHIFRVNGETTLDMEVAGTALSHPSDTSLWVGTKMHLHVTDAGFSFATTGASGSITERLRITSEGQITAAAGYTPVAASDLVTKQYVDNASATVGTYDASGTSAVAVVPGKDVYYSSVASAGGGLTMYAPTAGKPDVTIAAPSHAAIIINAPSGVLLRRGATTANLITIPPSTNCRFVGLSATEWLVLPSGGAS